MKPLFYTIIAIILTGAVNQKAMSQGKLSESKKAAASVLRHVVLFKFKDTSTPEQIKEVENAFSALKGKINTIIDYEWGTNVSPENLAQGFTHCFLVSFKDAAGRDFYLPHSAHKEFGKILGPHLDKALVVDFVSKR